jgi:hypothetical protein
MIWYVLIGSIFPWLLLFGGAVYLIHLWKRPGPEQLQQGELNDLKEQVALMRDFVRDAMERIARLEEASRSGRAVGPPGAGGLLPGEGEEEEEEEPGTGGS